MVMQDRVGFRLRLVFVARKIVVYHGSWLPVLAELIIPVTMSVTAIFSALNYPPWLRYLLQGLIDLPLRVEPRCRPVARPLVYHLS